MFVREAIIRKKILFYEKISQTGGGHLVFVSFIFFQRLKRARTGTHKKIKFHKTPTGGGHRFTKLFRKIEFFF